MDKVTSKFTATFWLKGVFITLFVFGSIVGFLNHVLNNNEPTNHRDLTITILLSIALVGVYIYSSIRSLRTITAAPEGLIIIYLLTKHKITIDYADITHVAYNRVSNKNGGAVSANYAYLTIELSTGEELTFRDDHIENFKELKDAIREFRFAESKDEANQQY